MLKAHYRLADEYLVEEMLVKLPPHQRDDEHRFHFAQALLFLRALGYDISKEVEITGEMEHALRSLDHPENYIKGPRPVRHVEL